MIRLALLGKDIQHSRSPEIYKELYENKLIYKLIDIPRVENVPALEDIFSSVDGLSITAPYKRHYLKSVHMEDEVRRLDAINCVVNRDGQYYATNTDYLAAKEIILRENYQKKDIVLFGDGAMANMFKVLLSELKIGFKQYSRKADGDLNLIDFGQTHNLTNCLIINCCSRSFHFKGKLLNQTIFWDMNYSHDFHSTSLSNQLTYIDGYELLYLQAVAAKKFWNFTL